MLPWKKTRLVGRLYASSRSHNIGDTELDMRLQGMHDNIDIAIITGGLGLVTAAETLVDMGGRLRGAGDIVKRTSEGLRRSKLTRKTDKTA